MMSSERQIMVISGTAHPEFAEKVSQELGIRLANVTHYNFADGEVGFRIEESVRGADVYVIQPTCKPVNDNLMELLIMVDALKRASAGRINLVMPYFGYARQDRQAKGREPISAKLVANMIEHAGTDRVVTADLHARQIQGFFDIPVDHLLGVPLLAGWFKEHLIGDQDTSQFVVVSPDAGGVVRARKLATLLRAEISIVDKRRRHDMANICEVMEIIGTDVADKTCIIIDDMIDTAGTIVNAAKALESLGAKEVYCSATHGLLSGPAIDRLSDDAVTKVVVTDTIPLPAERKLDKIVQVSMAPVFAEAIRRIHTDGSVSDLFE
ncbi:MULTISPECIES: ribose-phosphate diphosphokinase [Pyramidobacter]|uniref:ribose-phosphate diphosphokinase n=1 Tax=Pyramidobacter TaxID=638847 RepID=UPI00098F8577|nr:MULTISPECIES: ribose-phosphate pyrophosphokinase [Pyramidobacter]MDY3211598.1 ribose-phosphate pyrophosphokinase [Pyramidobacter sp.]OON88818.1 ribose-phosphate pyrophosphokinase [Pyramidobacter sp. C12-8]RKJ80567.1 ribose-phosphate pyrophosphokinase [Pyramidobacter sp. CG50-2]